MRILQISPYFYPSYRGTERTVANLSRGLANLGQEVDILTVDTEGAKKREVRNGTTHVRRCSLDFRYHRAVFSHELVKELLAAKNYDVYHIHIPFHSGLESAILASRINAVPIIATHHGEGPPVGFLHPLYNRFYRVFCLPRVKRVIFFTHSYPQSLELHRSVTKRIRVIRPTVDVSAFSPRKKAEQLRRTYGIDERDMVLLFVSALTREKKHRGADLLIEAMSAVKSEFARARLVVVGEGELLPGLRDLAKRLQLHHCVCFAGRIGEQSMPLHYAMCDLFVFPSSYDSFGYVVLQAMASGKPVIVSDIPGVGEVVKTGITGLKVPPGDIKALAKAIIQLLGNEDLRYEMARNARREVESRTWTDVAREVAEVYQETLS